MNDFLTEPSPALSENWGRSLIPATDCCAYLSSCIQGPIPAPTRECLAAFILNLTAPGSDDQDWSRMADEATPLLASLIGVSPEQITFTSSASEALALVLEHGLVRPGGVILLSREEYEPYVAFARRMETRGVSCRIVDRREQIPTAIDNSVELIIVSDVALTRGERAPLAEIVEACRQRSKARVVVDAVQSIGCVSLAPASLDVDFVIGTARKWLLGMPGLGFLYIGKRHLDTIFRPCSGTVQPSADADGGSALVPDLRAQRLSIGARNKSALLALRSSLSLIHALGPKRIQAHVLQLACAAVAEARARGLEVRTPNACTSGVVVVGANNRTVCAELVAHLKRADIYVARREDAIILSIHFFNTEKEVDLALASIAAFLL